LGDSVGQWISSLRERNAQRPVRAYDAPSVNHGRRLLFVFAAFVLMFVVIVRYVVDIQVLAPQKYIAYGESQRERSQTLAADRGSIVDRNGTELAISRPARSVFVDPFLIQPEEVAPTAAAVAPILGLDVADVESKMKMKNRFAYLARKVPVEVADQLAAKIKELGIIGVAFLEEKQRYFPAGLSARSLIGSVDVDNVGVSGLESQFADVLTGTPGLLSLERDPKGNTIAVGNRTLTPAVRGSDLRLTLDRSIQFEAERLLAEQIVTTKAKGGVAIVTIPATGEILAMANVVTDPTSGSPVVSSNNLALTTQYEPGSVMKMVTIAGAIDKGQVSASTVFNLPPTLKVHDGVFGEAEGRGTVDWSVSDILTNSSNVGTIKIAQGLGKESLVGFQRSFGFGTRTSLGFPNEAAGAVLDSSKFSGTSLPSIAIGQGIAVTPLQLLLAYNAIANRGVYVSPRLIQATIDPKGEEHATEVGGSHRVIAASTADTMNIMLRSVVAGGTGRLAAIDGYLAAGKTGTARKPQPGGGYTDRFGITRYQSTFVGFVPAEQPALSVYVMIDEPSAGDYTGGATAAPVFSKLGSFALRRLGIAPAATDASRGGAPIDATSVARSAMSTQLVVGDRVRAVTTSAPQTSVPLNVGTNAPTTTIVQRAGTTR
jgi:cell division protein FtsI (penicillin-binding protein 3)